MKRLKTSLEYMKANNLDGIYDTAITKQRSVFKYFLNGPEYREELPEKQEEPAAAAA